MISFFRYHGDLERCLVYNIIYFRPCRLAGFPNPDFAFVHFEACNQTLIQILEVRRYATWHLHRNLIPPLCL